MSLTLVIPPVTERQRRVLRVLHHWRKGFTVKALDRRMKLSRSSLYVVLGNLERKGLVAKHCLGSQVLWGITIEGYALIDGVGRRRRRE